MKHTASVLAATVLVASLGSALAADITGKITLKGTPPPETPITVTDPNCGKAKTPVSKTRFYAVGKDGGLADVFVYLKAGVTTKPAPSATPAALDQAGCEYTPYVVGVQTGQKITVKNSDQTLHNIHPTPQVAGNKESNRAQMAGGPLLEFTFDNPEILLRFKCDVHPWMFAYVGVVDHPYFAVTDADGNYTIKGVPAGKYTVEAVHRKTHLKGGGGLTKDVSVDASGAKADFVVELK
ncbi:MAG TPA: hypothetical protein VI454_11085 [Verrucomicrobiae bacterium]|jgi:plastocyanin